MAVHAAVFLITLSGLIFEIGLTRVYSANIWYHYTFIAVSVALLGWGLGGVVLHLLRRRIVVPTMEKAALLYAVTIPLCLWLIVQFPFRMERLALVFRRAAPSLPAGRDGAIDDLSSAPRHGRQALSRGPVWCVAGSAGYVMAAVASGAMRQ